MGFFKKHTQDLSRFNQNDIVYSMWSISPDDWDGWCQCRKLIDKGVESIQKFKIEVKEKPDGFITYLEEEYWNCLKELPRAPFVTYTDLSKVLNQIQNYKNGIKFIYGEKSAEYKSYSLCVEKLKDLKLQQLKEVRVPLGIVNKIDDCVEFVKQNYDKLTKMPLNNLLPDKELLPLIQKELVDEKTKTKRKQNLKL